MEFFASRGLLRAIRSGRLGDHASKDVVYHEAILHFVRDLLEARDARSLEALLNSDHAWERFAAAHFLARLDVATATDAIRSRVAIEPDQVVWRELMIALAFLGDRLACSQLVAALRDDKQLDELNERLVIDYFGGAVVAIEGCSVRLTERPDYPTREMLIWFLGSVGGRREIPVIRTYRVDSSATIRDAAVEAVNRIRQRAGRPKAIRALLLDLDGVIVDSIDDHVAAWASTWRELEKIEIDHMDVRLSEGKRSIEVAAWIAHSAGLSLERDRLAVIAGEKKKRMQQHERIRLITGAQELLMTVSQHGIPVVVVTGSGRQRTKAIEEVLPRGIIRGWITGDHAGRGKPAPDPYIAALLLVGCSAGDALAIENAPLGIDSAQRAGIYCAAITSTLTDDALWAADHVIAELSEAGQMLFGSRK
jgi:beta-phosphoglucomutase-like phosphatase (HAD superfamily)